mmetsp:Transcript_70736/g.133597  ORF Transcript_70736/g.133597 Transcript_70736/m.133597 type:complete len:100 (-) Transcript_70736:1180-1479(-)
MASACPPILVLICSAGHHWATECAYARPAVKCSPEPLGKKDSLSSRDALQDFEHIDRSEQEIGLALHVAKVKASAAAPSAAASADALHWARLRDQQHDH